MAFNFGGFLGGVAEGVNDAILREEERLDDKLALNRQEASLQRREKNRARLQEETLLKELTEQLAIHHDEDQIAQMSSKGLGAMKKFAEISQAEFLAGRDPSAAYNWTVATADIAPPPSSSTIGGAAKSDNLEQTTIQPTSFLKRPAFKPETYNDIETAFDQLAQQKAIAENSGNQARLEELTNYEAILKKRALSEGDGSTAKASTVTALLNYDFKSYFTGRKYKVGIENQLENIESGDGGKVAADFYGYASYLNSNTEYKKDKMIMSQARNVANQAIKDARSFADQQFVNRGQGLYFQDSAAENYHVIDVTGAEDMSGKERSNFVESAFKKYRANTPIKHGATVILRDQTDGGSFIHGKGVFSTQFEGGRIIGYRG